MNSWQEYISMQEIRFMFVILFWTPSLKNMFCVVVVPICFNFLSSLNTVSFIAGQQLQLLTLVSYGTFNGKV